MESCKASAYFRGMYLLRTSER
jgi:hypothetical protein